MRFAKTLMVLMLAIAHLFLDAQIAEVRTYGFTGGDERAKEVIDLSDGGYAFIGTTNANDGWSTDIILYRLDADLNVVWTQVYGFAGLDEGVSLVQKVDGGFYFLATTLNAQNSYHLQLYSVDEFGNMIQTLDLGTSDWDFAVKMKLLIDGGLIILGETYSVPSNDRDLLLICLNNDLTPRWTQTLGGELEDFAADVEQAGNGTLYILGTSLISELPEQYSFHYWKMDENGITEWDETMDIPGSYFARGLATMANGFVATGHQITASGNDKFILRIDSDANLIWDRHYPLEGNQSLADVVVLPDLGFGLAGETDAFGLGGWGVYVMEADGNGIWVNAAVFGDVQNEKAYSVLLDSSFRIIFAGESNSYEGNTIENYLVRLSNDQVYAEYTLDLEHFQQDSFTGIEEESGMNSANTFLLDGSNILYDFRWVQAQVDITDINGSLIWSGFSSDGNLNLSQHILCSGMYLLVSKTESKMDVCRLLKP